MSLLLGPTSSSQSAMTTSSEKSPLHKHFLFPDHFGEVSEMLVESQTLIKVAHTKPILAIKQGMSCEGACAHGHVPCVECACMQHVFVCTMCDPTFAHFFEQNCQKLLIFVLKIF